MTKTDTGKLWPATLRICEHKFEMGAKRLHLLIVTIEEPAVGEILLQVFLTDGAKTF